MRLSKLSSISFLLAWTFPFWLMPTCAELPPYVVAQWSFDGDAKDAGPNSLDARIEDAEFMDSPWGQCVSFDGLKSFVSVDDPKNLLSLDKAFTYELWVRARKPTNRRIMPAGDKPNPYRFILGRGVVTALMHRLGSVVGRLRDPAGKTHFEYAGTKLHPDVWAHLAMTYDGDFLRCYENGRLLSYQSLRYKLAESRVGFRIGNLENRRYGFHGLIDEVRISDRALAPKEFFRLPKVMRQAADRSPAALPALDTMNPNEILTLANSKVSLKFWKRDARLISLFDKRQEHEYIAGNITRNSAPWRITLRSDMGLGLEFKSGSVGLRPDRCAVQKAADGQEAVFSWQSLDLGDEKGSFEVTMTIGLPDGSPMTYWRISVRNRSRVWGIWDVQFPDVEISQPVDNPGENFLAIPFRMGRCISNPVRANKADSIDNEMQVFHQHYPLNMHCQFMAFYGGDAPAREQPGKGFYWAYHDGLGYEKRWDVFANPRKRLLRFQGGHVPQNLAVPGEDYTLPYPVVMGPYSGDWYDACQIYRTWALKQSWASKGPLHARQDVPQWLKDVCLVVRNQTSGPRGVTSDSDLLKSQQESVPQNVAGFTRCLESFKSPIMSVWYQKQRERSAFPGETFYSAACVHCGELVQPVHGLKEANTRLATKQGYPTAYVATSVYDPGDNVDKPQADRWATRSITGSIVSDEEISMHRMCYNTDWWQQRIADICGTAVKDGGFKGIYLDTFGRWSRRCYAAEAHGHSLGGGRQGTRGMHLLAERVRERVRALDAETVMTAEASIEYFIDVLDGRLLSMSILPDHCPIFPAVYHDYTTFFGRTTVPFPDKPNLLRMKLANLFVMGAQLGRLFIHYDPPTLFAPERKDDLEYFRRLVSYKHAARKFLNLGKFLRPVKMLTTMPSISSKHWYRDTEVTMPVVASSSWLAPHGTVGIVFTNLGSDRFSFRYQFNTVDYGFGQDEQLLFRPLTPAATKTGQKLKSGLIEREEVLDSLGVSAYIIEAE